MTMMTQGAPRIEGLDIRAEPIKPFSHFSRTGLNHVREVYAALSPNRDTLDVLFSLDAAQTAPTEDWVRFFIEISCAQLIWDERPTGTLSEADARWALRKFDDAPSLAILAILVRLAEEAHQRPSWYEAEVRQRAALFSNLLHPRASAKTRSVPYLRLVG